MGFKFKFDERMRIKCIGALKRIKLLIWLGLELGLSEVLEFIEFFILIEILIEQVIYLMGMRKNCCFGKLTLIIYEPNFIINLF